MSDISLDNLFLFFAKFGRKPFMPGFYIMRMVGSTDHQPFVPNDPKRVAKEQVAMPTTATRCKYIKLSQTSNYIIIPITITVVTILTGK